MPNRMPLAACVSFAAAMSFFVSGPLSAQSQSQSQPGRDAGARLATAPQPTKAASPTSGAAPVEALDPVPDAESLAPVPSDGKAAEASGAAAPAPSENTPPGATATPAPAAAPIPPAQMAEIDPLVTQVRQQLATSKLPDSTAAERAAMVAFYADRSG